MIRQVLLVSVFLGLTSVATAQIMPQPAGTDSIRHAFFPVIGYSSDAGFMGGAVYNRYDYTGNTRPFNSYIQSSAIVSTKGFIKLDGLYEKTKAFGTDLRSTTELFFYRRANDTFFGIGNKTTYSQALWEQGYYYFESVSFGLDFRLRKPVYGRGRSSLDLLLGAGSEYHIPYTLQPVSSFELFMPNGSRGGFVNYLTGGLVWENRDREFDPRSGNRAELDFRFAPPLASDYAMAKFRLDLRQYFYVLDFLTIANRLQAEHATGDVPYWALPSLGDEYTLRGYPLYRFRGSSSLAYNLELRSWMFTFPEYRLKLGVQLFTDVGRVFTRQDDFGDLFRGYKQTYGFGGAMSLFSPDFILRGDIGFSGETSRIYIGIGYTF